MKNTLLIILALTILISYKENQEDRPSRQIDAKKDSSNEIDTSIKVISVNTDYFISENIIDKI